MTPFGRPSLRRSRVDEVPALTSLLHRAYAPLAARGLRYVASHQTETTTRDRISRGECWVADLDGAAVGTVTWYRTTPDSDCGHYRRTDVAHFGQYAVEPHLQGRGIGAALLGQVERRAAEEGFAHLACDTAEPATDLIALYERRGFRRVGTVRWESVNYRSVVLSKPLGA